MIDPSAEPPTPPPGMRYLALSADEMDYLTRYWETPDHAKIFGWAAKLLYDLTKLDEGGWRLVLAKAEVDEETKQVTYDEEHRHLVFLLKWLCPTSTTYSRIPPPEVLDERMRVNPKEPTTI